MSEAITPRLGVASTDTFLWRDPSYGVLRPNISWEDQEEQTIISEAIDVLGFKDIGIDVVLAQVSNDIGTAYFQVSVEISLTGLSWIALPDAAFNVPLSTIELQSPGDNLHIDLTTVTHFVRLMITCVNGDEPFPATLQAFIAMVEA